MQNRVWFCHQKECYVAPPVLTRLLCRQKKDKRQLKKGEEEERWSLRLPKRKKRSERERGERWREREKEPLVRDLPSNSDQAEHKWPTLADLSKKPERAHCSSSHIHKSSVSIACPSSLQYDKAVQAGEAMLHIKPGHDEEPHLHAAMQIKIAWPSCGITIPRYAQYIVDGKLGRASYTVEHSHNVPPPLPRK